MNVSRAKRLEILPEYYFSRKLQEVRDMEAKGHDIINLGIGSPDLPPPPAAIEAICRAAAEPRAHGYQPYNGTVALREAFSGWYSRIYDVELDPGREVLPLLGSKEGIMYLSMAFLDAGDEILAPDPGYPIYAKAAEMFGAKVRFYKLRPEKDWLCDLDELAAMDTSRVKMMWINYPHMPTGAVASESHLAAVLNFAKSRNILLCHDNPYSLILNPRPVSILHIPGAADCAVELNSLSKSHHMAGWRVGLLAGNAEVLRSVLAAKTNIDSGSFLGIQKAAIAALQTDLSWHEENNRIYSARQKACAELLRQTGCSLTSGQAGLFLWAKIPDTAIDAAAFTDQMLAGPNLFLTPGHIFGSQGQRYVRASLCVPEDRIRDATSRISQLTNAHK